MKILIRNLFNKLKEYLLLIFLLILSLSLLPLNKNSNVSKIRSYAFGVIVVTGNIIDSFVDIFQSSAEIESLQYENAKLMLEVNSLREYALENSELKGLLEFKESNKYKLIPSTVVAKNISNTQGIFIINSGRSDSISVSMPVISERGLVGIITETSENFSIVKTLGNASLRISANIPRTNINGVASWTGSKFILKNIPSTADLNKGDRVVTSVLSTIFPPSIPIGLIIKKEKNISGVLSDVRIKPFVDVERVKNVFVLSEMKSTQIDSLELNLLRN